LADSKININYKKWPVFPYYPAATILPFGQSRTVESDVLFKQFISAQKLMNQYKYQQKKTHEILMLIRWQILCYAGTYSCKAWYGLA